MVLICLGLPCVGTWEDPGRRSGGASYGVPLRASCRTYTTCVRREASWGIRMSALENQTRPQCGTYTHGSEIQELESA